MDFTGSLIVYLRAQLSPAPVVAQVPRERPLSFLVVRRIGGPFVRPVVDNPTITAEAWAATQGLAWELMHAARSRVTALQGQSLNGAAVYRVEEFAGPAWLPDPDTGSPRWTVTFSIRHREHLQPV